MSIILSIIGVIVLLALAVLVYFGTQEFLSRIDDNDDEDDYHGGVGYGY